MLSLARQRKQREKNPTSTLKSTRVRLRRIVRFREWTSTDLEWEAKKGVR